MKVNTNREFQFVWLAHSILNAAGMVTRVFEEGSREDDPFVSAAVQEPYIVLRSKIGKVSVYHGDAAAMTLKQLYRPPDGETVSAVNEFMM